MPAITTASGQPTEVGPSRVGRTTTIAAAVAGGLFVTEAVISPLVDSHLGYHLPNLVLNGALAVACVGLAGLGRRRVGKAVVAGGWITAFLASLVTLGGAWTVAVEGFTTAKTPGVVEGISHTAVLLSLLPMIAIGLGLRRFARLAGWALAGGSAVLVLMVAVGLDDPLFFLFPEAMVGMAWLLVARSLSSTAPPVAAAGS